jgi:hypothetical protein
MDIPEVPMKDPAPLTIETDPQQSKRDLTEEISMLAW